MRFRIVRTYLTDENGRATTAAELVVSHHVLDADSVDDALRLFVEETGSEVLGEVKKYPGLQAVATARRAQHVFTVEVNPVTGRLSE